jgi:hypothetical protein
MERARRWGPGGGIGGTVADASWEFNVGTSASAPSVVNDQSQSGGRIGTTRAVASAL